MSNLPLEEIHDNTPQIHAMVWWKEYTFKKLTVGHMIMLEDMQSDKTLTDIQQTKWAIQILEDCILTDKEEFMEIVLWSSLSWVSKIFSSLLPITHSLDGQKEVADEVSKTASTK